MHDHTKIKPWVVTVDMGYGHLRAVQPFKDIAYKGIIVANNYRGIPDADKDLWEGTRVLYEAVSRFKHVPILGDLVFSFMDYLQQIPAFYPRRDLSKPTFQVKEIYHTIRHRQWGKDLIDMLAKDPRPLLTSFFTVAFFAEAYGYPEEIYCITTDADISRAWVPLDPQKSRIKYMASNTRVMERLKRYGIAPENIYLTGFPLPKENTGSRSLLMLKQDLGARLINLDPHRHYFDLYSETIYEHVGKHNIAIHPTHPLTLTFAVGGAGAQRELGITVVESLAHRLQSSEIKLNLIAGSRKDVADFFRHEIEALQLGHLVEYGMIKILYAEKKEDYFTEFHEVLRTTDILWTKPSELSFYAALGLPIIMSPPIGSQEMFNRLWLKSVGAGITQENPRYTNEWLFDWIESGWLAEAAMNGFLDAPKFGTYNIEDVIAGKGKPVEELHQII